MKRLNDILEGREGSYILPFFWLHGEDHAILKDEIDRIEACGIREFCVESRPHPDFMGEQWWSDMDMIMDEARKRHMRVWLLDDDKFPTGHAAGGYEKQPDKAKIYLAQRHMDLCGPLKDGAVLIENFLGSDGKLLGIYACKKPDPDISKIDLDTVIDLTDQVCQGVVYFDLPEGYYRLFVLFTTREGGGRRNYINLIDSASVRVLIDQVYEPHYERYKADFGKTFAGFFSDEPELGNVPGYGFHERLGQKDVRLPWSRELKERLEDMWGSGDMAKLIALWFDAGEQTEKIRMDYMDQVSFLVSRCFSGQLGRWCQEHQVRYIGHVIEDDNAHARLGCSIAHFFRAESGMSMAGIDVVHLQIIPGFKYCDHQWIASDRDGEFFHFGLGKMGSSLAHLDPKKSGRALCEIFGSFGWAEGIWLMKWLTDHMLVRGINTFVPHAFSPIYPDRDCPPHFYARGNNPQYPYFIKLMNYMNRMCHLLNGGKMLTDAAVLYHGEAEWCGDTQLFQRPVRLLMEHQIDCDVVWNDLLLPENSTFQDRCLKIGSQSYSCLIIPGCSCLPESTCDFIRRSIKEGFPVFFTNRYPEKLLSDKITLDEIYEGCLVINESELAEKVLSLCDPQIRVLDVSGSREDLRACAYAQKDGCVYMFFNENPHKPVTATVCLKYLKDHSRAHLTAYDGVTNTAAPAYICKDQLMIHLCPGASAVYIAGQDDTQNRDVILTEILKYEPSDQGITLEGPWEISLKETGKDQDFAVVKENVRQLKSINAADQWPRFSGQIRYRTQISLSKPGQWLLKLPGVHDGTTVYINGQEAGVLIGSPYCLNISPFIKLGENDLEIETVNTLTWRIHDGQSTHMQMNPTGMVAPPILYNVHNQQQGENQ